MSKIERIIVIIILLFISISAVSWVGKEYFALLAIFELLVGFIAGMTVFIQRNN